MLTNKLILASASPRRLQLLAQVGLNAEVFPANIDESPKPTELAGDYVQRLADNKARFVAQQYNDNSVVIAADTVVSMNGNLLGKPQSKEQAFAMWQQLSGCQHQVYTGVSVLTKQREQTCLSCSDIYVKPLSPEEMEDYWHSKEPQDKAGGYAIQGRAAAWITRLEGSYSSVMGLPLYETLQMLNNVGVR